MGTTTIKPEILVVNDTFSGDKKFAKREVGMIEKCHNVLYNVNQKTLVRRIKIPQGCIW